MRGKSFLDLDPEVIMQMQISAVLQKKKKHHKYKIKEKQTEKCALNILFFK